MKYFNQRSIKILVLLFLSMGIMKTAVCADLPPFKPSTHGWPFANNFCSTGTVSIWSNTMGLCGGMCFGALDYYYAGNTMTNVPPGTPMPGSFLFDYLYKRQEASLPSWVISKMLDWQCSSEDGFRNYVRHDEWPRLKTNLDEGTPTVLFLLTESTCIGDYSGNHQVIAYKYTINNEVVHISVYDPSFPREDKLTITFRLADGGLHAAFEYPADPQERGHLRAFFVNPYDWQSRRSCQVVSIKEFRINNHPRPVIFTAFDNLQIWMSVDGRNLASGTMTSMKVYNGPCRLDRMITYRGDVITSFLNAGIFRSPNGNFLGGGTGSNTEHVYTGTMPVKFLLNFKDQGVVTVFSSNNFDISYFSPDGRNLGGGGNTIRSYSGAMHIKDVIPSQFGLYSVFPSAHSDIAYLSNDGRRLGADVRVYSGGLRIKSIVPSQFGIYSVFPLAQSDIAYLSADGQRLGADLRVYAGGMRIKSIVPSQFGVYSIFPMAQGDLIYLSTDGRRLGADEQVYPGLMRVKFLRATRFGVYSVFSTSGAGDVAYLSRDGRNLGAVNNVYNAGCVIKDIVEVTDGILTVFGSSVPGDLVYLSPDGINLGGGGQTIRCYP